jgi:hypothetical protein
MRKKPPGPLDARTLTRGLPPYVRLRRGHPLNTSMDVGLEVLLLTRLPSSFPWDEVPYSGDGEFSPAWDEPGCGDRLARRIPS